MYILAFCRCRNGALNRAWTEYCRPVRARNCDCARFWPSAYHFFKKEAWSLMSLMKNTSTVKRTDWWTYKDIALNEGGSLAVCLSGPGCVSAWTDLDLTFLQERLQPTKLLSSLDPRVFSITFYKLLVLSHWAIQETILYKKYLEGGVGEISMSRLCVYSRADPLKEKAAMFALPFISAAVYKPSPSSWH